MDTDTRPSTQVALTGIHLEIAALESRLKLVNPNVSTLNDLHVLVICSGEDPQKIVTRHIKLLQDYNEAKDKAQVT